MILPRTPVNTPKGELRGSRVSCAYASGDGVRGCCTDQPLPSGSLKNTNRPPDERSQPAARQQVKQRDQGQDPEYQEGRENDARHAAANTPPVVLAVILRELLDTRSPR